MIIKLGPQLGPLGESIKNQMQESAKEQTQQLTYDIVFGILDGLRDILVELSYSVALIGGGLCIIFHVAGWKEGKRWAGILTVGYVLVKFLLG